MVELKPLLVWGKNLSKFANQMTDFSLVVEDGRQLEDMVFKYDFNLN